MLLWKAPGEAQGQILWSLWGVEKHQGNSGHWRNLDAIPGGDCFTEMTRWKELISSRVASGVPPIRGQTILLAAELILESGASALSGVPVAQTEFFP